mgnify:CR=1 FL=1
MDTIVGLFISLFDVIFGNIFAFIAFYLLILVNIKLFGIWKVKTQDQSKKGFKTDSSTRKLNITIFPRCGNKSTRINRDNLDKARTVLSLNTMKWKKYTCYSCYWEGSRWD